MPRPSVASPALVNPAYSLRGNRFTTLPLRVQKMSARCAKKLATQIWAANYFAYVQNI
jgi:hypothetical protein